MITEKFDVICIGSGSGGLSASKHAARLGKTVALIEADVIGGTCLNSGCIPKKIMYNAAVLKAEESYLYKYGIYRQDEPIHWIQLKHSMSNYINNARKSILSRVEKDNITYIEGYGTIKTNKVVTVLKKDNTTLDLEFDQLILSSGSTTSSIPIFLNGSEHIIDHKDFFKIKRQPSNVVIVGSGYIAVELATILSLLGTKVHLIMRSVQPLKFLDQSYRTRIYDNLVEQGVIIHKESRIRSIKKIDPHYLVNLQDNQNIECDWVLWAAGRDPNLSFLQNSKVRILKRPDGKLSVDARLRAEGHENIWVIGDLLNTPNLTPVAIAQGKVVAHYLYGSEILDVDYELCVPTTVYCYPPLSTCGLSYKNAYDKFDGKVFKINKRFLDMNSAVGNNPFSTSIQMVFSQVNNVLVGIQIHGPKSDEIIQGFALCIKKRVTLKEIRSFVPIHPTIAEEIFYI